MGSYSTIRSGVLRTLETDNRWMTASEIINRAHGMGVMERKNKKSRKAHSHPAYRVLTSMCVPDAHRVYSPEITRRVRTSGPETGSYEYALTGISGRIRRWVPAIRNA